jgi:hypothetical protein
VRGAVRRRRTYDIKDFLKIQPIALNKAGENVIPCKVLRGMTEKVKSILTGVFNKK